MLLLIQLIDLYSLVVLASVVMSWIGTSHDNPIARFTASMTEPLLDPIRRVLPDMGGLDFSPMVLLIGLRIVRGIITGGL